MLNQDSEFSKKFLEKNFYNSTTPKKVKNKNDHQNYFKTQEIRTDNLDYPFSTQ